jgi:hypothetical protein
MARKKSFEIIRDKSLYRSIAFTRAERRRLGLEGLLPDAVATQAELVAASWSSGACCEHRSLHEHPRCRT